MDSKRQQKYARLIQKDLGEILQRDTKSLFGGAFITITTVRVSPDLSIAKIYLSIFKGEEKQKVLETINQERKQIRKQLADRIKNQARIIPELLFYLDDNVDYANNIDKILSQLNIPPGEDTTKNNSEEDKE